MSRPVCVLCHVEFDCLKNGVGVLKMTVESGKQVPYQLWEADMWECPGCKSRIVSGFGRAAIAEAYHPSFENAVRAEEVLIKVYTDVESVQLD